MKTYNHNEMEENVILGLIDFLGLPNYIKWFELHFEYNKDPLVLFCDSSSDKIFTKKISIKNSSGDSNKSIVEEMELQIAGLFKEIPRSFRLLILRFEAAEIPTMTTTCELWSAYEDLGIKDKISDIKNSFICELMEEEAEGKIGGDEE